MSGLTSLMSSKSANIVFIGCYLIHLLSCDAPVAVSDLLPSGWCPCCCLVLLPLSGFARCLSVVSLLMSATCVCCCLVLLLFCLGLVLDLWSMQLLLPAAYLLLSVHLLLSGLVYSGLLYLICPLFCTCVLCLVCLLSDLILSSSWPILAHLSVV